jgi:hypothetical protein
MPQRRNRQNQNSRRGSVRNARTAVSRINHPPQIRSNVQFRHKMRFAGTMGSTVINSAQLAFAFGSVGTVTNSTVVSVIGSLRLIEVELWSSPTSASTSALSNVSCEFSGSNANISSTSQFSDTSVNPAEPAHIRCRPPRGSNSAFWQFPGVSANNMFTINGTSNICIIDVTCDLVLSDDELSSLTRTVSTAVLGQMYYLALDNTNAGAHTLSPVALVSTF